MSRRRVFIAINFPESFKSRVIAFEEKWAQLPVRWMTPSNLHLTVVPPMHLTDDELSRLIGAVREIARTHADFELDFERFVYAPPGTPRIRMIWLLGPKNAALSQLKRSIEQGIVGARVPYREEHRPLTPHITVARMRSGTWTQFAPKPNIEEEYRVSLPVHAVDIMQSALKRGGAEYTILEHIPLGGN